MKTYKEFLKAQESNENYLITGQKVNGQRFTIATKTPFYYNIYKGSIWSINENGKRKLLKRIYNF